MGNFCNLRSDIDSLQFQLTFEIPVIKTRAQYSSTGVLLLIKASGHGDYWGEYREYFEEISKYVFNKTIFKITGGVKAKIYFKASPYEKDNDVYLTVETMKMDFSVKNIQMGVENIENKNSVIRKLFYVYPMVSMETPGILDFLRKYQASPFFTDL
jgi:hypothetical protein